MRIIPNSNGRVSNDYYILKSTADRTLYWEKVDGTPIEIKEEPTLDIFWRKDDDGEIVVSDGITGRSWLKRWDVENAIRTVKYRIAYDIWREYFSKETANSVADTGVSPRYGGSVERVVAK